MCFPHIHTPKLSARMGNMNNNNNIISLSFILFASIIATSVVVVVDATSTPTDSQLPNHLNICIVNADEMPFYERTNPRTACTNFTHPTNDVESSFRGFLIDIVRRMVTHLRMDDLTGPANYYCIDSDHDTALLSFSDTTRLAHQPECDIIVGALVPTFNRTNVADFTHPFFIGGGIGLAKLDSGFSSNQWGFLKPYEWKMWLWILALVIGTEYALMYGETGSNRAWVRRFATGNDVQRFATCVVPFIRGAGAILSGGVDSPGSVKTFYGKFHVAILRFCIILMFIFYGSRVTANMVAQNPRFFSIADAEDFVSRSRNIIGGKPMTTVEHRVALAQLGVRAHRVFDSNAEMKSKIFSTNSDDGSPDVSLLMWPHTQMTWALRDRCDIDFSDGPILSYSLALAVRPGLPVHLINQEVLQLEQEGLLRQFQTRVTNVVKTTCSSVNIQAQYVVPFKSMLVLLTVPTVSWGLYLIMSIIFNSYWDNSRKEYVQVSRSEDSKEIIILPSSVEAWRSDVAPDKKLFLTNN